MRYTEPKARSAELLRMALAQMGRHAASFNPISFSVWYEHVAGINAGLSKALSTLAEQAVVLDDAAVLALYQDHIAPPSGDMVDHVGGELQRLMHRIEQSASQAGHQAGDFGERLVGFSAALGSSDGGDLAAHLDQMRAGTLEMRQSVMSLQQQVAGSQREIERLRSDLERARCEALVDPLTGILNRKGFDERMQALMAQRPAAGRTHCLVMLDIDHFKQVNDTHGHLVGDRVIQGLGEVLRCSLTDPAHTAARYGGEEFAIIVPHSSLDLGAQVAETVRRRTKAMKFKHRGTQETVLSVTVSGGVAAWRDDEDVASLVARADGALYVSKHAGRDRVTCA